jgi:hypothetical protein
MRGQRRPRAVRAALHQHAGQLPVRVSPGVHPAGGQAVLQSQHPAGPPLYAQAEASRTLVYPRTVC